MKLVNISDSAKITKKKTYIFGFETLEIGIHSAKNKSLQQFKVHAQVLQKQRILGDVDDNLVSKRCLKKTNIQCISKLPLLMSFQSKSIGKNFGRHPYNKSS